VRDAQFLSNQGGKGTGSAMTGYEEAIDLRGE
jgi:hypothetical protein